MNITDIFLENFIKVDIHKLARIPMIVIYAKPKDYPEHYIARLWDGNKPTNYTAIRDNLNSIRTVIPQKMHKVTRSENDDPVIVETWI